jgi:hypothetical protein
MSTGATKTIVRGLRDGQSTAGTGWRVRKIKEFGAKVTIAASGRVTVVDKRGIRHVYVLVLDPTVDNSPLTQALVDLENKTIRASVMSDSGGASRTTPRAAPPRNFIAKSASPKKSHAQIKREVDAILAGRHSRIGIKLDPGEWWDSLSRSDRQTVAEGSLAGSAYEETVSWLPGRTWKTIRPDTIREVLWKGLSRVYPIRRVGRIRA